MLILSSLLGGGMPNSPGSDSTMPNLLGGLTAAAPPKPSVGGAVGFPHVREPRQAAAFSAWSVRCGSHVRTEASRTTHHLPHAANLSRRGDGRLSMTSSLHEPVVKVVRPSISATLYSRKASRWSWCQSYVISHRCGHRLTAS